MDKQLKKSYEILDLPYISTTEEVEFRKNALIKVLRDEGQDKGHLDKKYIDKIEKAAQLIIDSLKKNGCPNMERQSFDSSWSSIGFLAVTLFFVAILCAISFYIFS